jgi:6-phosphofructokinase 1
MSVKRIAILTSGGDAPGMNAAIRAVVRTAVNLGIEVFGVYDGYKGLVEGKIEQFDSKSVSHILSQGGTILGSSRLPEFKEKVVRELAVKQLNKLYIDGLVVIGGDGTFAGGLRLHEMGVKIIGVPATIDNDVASTDFTIGFSTALNTILDAIDKLRDTAESHQRCSVLEVMGRRCGDLALYSGICGGAEYVITNDTGFNKQEMLDSLRRKRLRGRRHAIVILTENTTNPEELAKEIEEYSGYETRATVLGYVQRGGRPSPEDRVLASRLGSYAVDLLNEGKSGLVVGTVNNKIISTPIVEALNMKYVPNQELYDLVKIIR